jgi:replication-associated recombination protein RarA
MKYAGYGEGYRYVHSDPQAKDEMPCLPERLRGKIYYEDDEQAQIDIGEINERASEARQK